MQTSEIAKIDQELNFDMAELFDLLFEEDMPINLTKKQIKRSKLMSQSVMAKHILIAHNNAK